MISKVADYGEQNLCCGALGAPINLATDKYKMQAIPEHHHRESFTVLTIGETHDGKG